MTPKPRVTVLSFSYIARDARVLRHIQFLAERYDVTAIGYGDNPHPGITWRPVQRRRNLYDKAVTLLTLVLGRVWPRLYKAQLSLRGHYRAAARALRDSQPDVILGNEVVEMVIAVREANQRGVYALYDAHEYKVAAETERRWWRWWMGPFFRYCIAGYAPCAAVMFTTSPIYAAWYAWEFGLQARLLRNMPREVALPAPPTPAEPFRLVHHGIAVRSRRMEDMIMAVALSGRRFELILHLVPPLYGPDMHYIEELKAYAERHAPGQVRILPPIPPDEIVPTLAEYDIGLVMVPPINDNQRGFLPNKLFEFINAGLMVCSGPSPAIQAVLTVYAVGVVTPTFAPADVARALRDLTPETLHDYQRAAHQAAPNFTAEREMQILLDAVASLTDSNADAARLNPSDE